MILCMWILLFQFLAFLWYCVDVLIYGGTVSLPKYFFFKMVYVSGIVSHLKLQVMKQNVKFTHTGHVILQLILDTLCSKTLLQAFQPYKLPLLTSQLHLA